MLALGVAAPLAVAENRAANVRHFTSAVKPLLKAKCYECHSHAAGKSKGGLMLDSMASILKGGGSGPALVAGKPKDSLILEVVKLPAGEDGVMPPKKPLSRREIAVLDKWIAGGAYAPKSEAKTDATLEERARKLWSLKPVKKPKPGATIDSLVDTKLKANGLTPAGRAEPERLIRRLTFDLIGLPPTPQEVNRFVANPSDSAYRSIVADLLARPQFGERWGRHWLDTARYADCNGGDRQHVFKQAWRYRNWVIDAHREDKPYDRFLAEQIAGDLLPAADDAARRRQLVATGFLAIGSKPLPNRDNEEAEKRLEIVTDPIDAVFVGTMGMTVGCAKCHDHKFDPIPTKDYYALAGVFRSTRLWYGPNFGYSASRQHLLDHLYDPNLVALDEDRQRKLKPIQEAYLKAKDGHRRAENRKKNVVPRLEKQIANEKDPAKLANHKKHLKETLAENAAWQKAYEAFMAEHGDVAEALKKKPLEQVMAATEAEPVNVHLRYSGEFDKKGPLVPRGLLTLVPVPGVDTRIDPGESGRRQLAAYIASADNPLTARVAVNRVWYRLMGRGIVETLDNFGLSGAEPTHPELLDHLAHNFVHRHGWSRKALIRQIVSSEAYRRDASATGALAVNLKADPENLYRWRMTPRRLEAEAIRDGMLAVAGKLELDRPRRSVVEHFNYHVGGKLDNRRLPKAMGLVRTGRRSVYLPVFRLSHGPLNELFDYPDDEAVNSARSANTFATQGLYLMNNPMVVDAARAFAARVGREHADDRAKIKSAYMLAFSRRPTASELSDDLAYLRAETRSPKIAWEGLCQSLLVCSEFLYRF